MSATTGPVLAIGAVTLVNQSVFHSKPIDWRVPVATGLAALVFAGAERMWAEGARMLAYTALVAVCLTRIDPDIPSPAESALAWWGESSAAAVGGRAGSGTAAPSGRGAGRRL